MGSGKLRAHNSAESKSAGQGTYNSLLLLDLAFNGSRSCLVAKQTPRNIQPRGSDCKGGGYQVDANYAAIYLVCGLYCLLIAITKQGSIDSTVDT